MGPRWFILEEDGETPRGVDDIAEYVAWEKTHDRRVCRTDVGDNYVSTVFLGLNHQYGAGAPVLWETMVFGGPLDGTGDRYTSHAAAVKGHAAWVEKARRADN